jgi:hypothetical protein
MIKKVTCGILLVTISFFFCLVKIRAADVTVTGVVPPTTVTLSGVAPASSTITIIEDGVVVATTITSVAGAFTRTITSTAGIHNYSLFLTDTGGLTTPNTDFNNVTLTVHTDTQINNIHMPTTIALSRITISNGESTLIYGQGAPSSIIHVYLNGTEKFSGVVGSAWQFTLSSGYHQGNNTIYALLTRGGYSDSVNSYTVNLNVTACGRSDLNCDGFVNLTDFSILLYYWGTNNFTADINKDGSVGLIDFSIMMFDWTG